MQNIERIVRIIYFVGFLVAALLVALGLLHMLATAATASDTDIIEQIECPDTKEACKAVGVRMCEARNLGAYAGGRFRKDDDGAVYCEVACERQEDGKVFLVSCVPETGKARKRTLAVVTNAAATALLVLLADDNSTTEVIASPHVPEGGE